MKSKWRVACRDGRVVLALAGAGPLVLPCVGFGALLNAQAVDSVGVEIVQVGPADDGWAVSGPCVLGDEPSVQIGSLAGEESALFRVEAAVQLPDGRIAVANAGSGEIKVFGEAGEHVWSVGRLGDGPGDFRDLAALGVHDDRILAYDSEPSRITAIDFGGQIVGATQVEFASRQYERTGGVAGGLAMARGMPAVGWLGRGVLILHEERSQSRGRVVLGETVELLESTEDLVFVGSDGSLVARIEGLPGDESVRRRNITPSSQGMAITLTRMTTPYSKTFQAAVGQSRIVAGHTATDDVRFFDANGQLVRILRRLNRPRRVGDGAKDAWIRAQTERFDPPQRRSFRERLSAVEFPEYMPAFESLALDARDRLWVQEFVGPEAVGGSRWTVYDAGGAPAGMVAMPPRFRPASFGPDHVLGVWEDDLDVEYVQRYDLSEGCKTL